MVRRYLHISCMVDCGLLHTDQNSENVSRWSLASRGSSARRKWRAGVGEDGLSFRKPRNIFLWKAVSGSAWVWRIGKERSPDLTTELVKVCHRWLCRLGERRHLYAKADPSRANSDFRPLIMLVSTFFSISSVPLTRSPRWSLSMVTGILLHIEHKELNRY